MLPPPGVGWSLLDIKPLWLEPRRHDAFLKALPSYHAHVVPYCEHASVGGRMGSTCRSSNGSYVHNMASHTWMQLRIFKGLHRNFQINVPGCKPRLT